MGDERGSTDTVPATYREIAIRFGLKSGADAGRLKAKRAGWRTEPGNHPKDPVRVHVPRKAWEAVNPVEPLGFKPSANPVQPPPDPPLNPVEPQGFKPPLNPVQPPVDFPLIAELHQRLGQAEAERDSAKAERARLETELQAAEARHASELATLHQCIGRTEAELEAARDLARDQAAAAAAERDRLKTDLAEWQAGSPLARAWRAFWSR